MAPRVKVTGETVVNAAVEVVRECGAQALNARALAARLGCSTQPIFSYFASMEELRRAVAQRAEALCGEYVREETERGEFPPYKAGGMAYIRFAKEERELFKLLYMCDRTGEPIPEGSELTEQMEVLVHRNTGLDGLAVKRFHLEMWAFVHGIAAMLATGFLDLGRELISTMLTDAYQGLRRAYQEEE